MLVFVSILCTVPVFLYLYTIGWLTPYQISTRQKYQELIDKADDRLFATRLSLILDETDQDKAFETMKFLKEEIRTLELERDNRVLRFRGEK